MFSIPVLCERSTALFCIDIIFAAVRKLLKAILLPVTDRNFERNVVTTVRAELKGLSYRLPCTFDQQCLFIHKAKAYGSALAFHDQFIRFFIIRAGNCLSVCKHLQPADLRMNGIRMDRAKV